MQVTVTIFIMLHGNNYRSSNEPSDCLSHKQTQYSHNIIQSHVFSLEDKALNIPLNWQSSHTGAQYSSEKDQLSPEEAQLSKDSSKLS